MKADALLERSERKLETINSYRRQLRFVPEGASAGAAHHARYVQIPARCGAIFECARQLKAQLGAAVARLADGPARGTR